MSKTPQQKKQTNCAALKKGSDKSLNFIELLDCIKPGEFSQNKMKEFSKMFLDVIGGQALCVLTSEDHKEYLPNIIEGENTELLRTCFYKPDEAFAEKVFDSENPLQFSEKDNFSGDILLEELSKTIKFKVAAAAPLGSRACREGIIIVLGDPGQESYKTADLKLLKAFSEVMGLMSRFASAQSRVEAQAREIDSKDFDLYTVYHVSKSLSSILDLDELCTMLVDMLTEILTVKCAVVFLADEEEEKIFIKSSKSLDNQKTCPSDTITISEKSSDWLVQQTFEGTVITDFSDPVFVQAFPGAQEIFSTLEIEAAVPMIYKYKLIGFLAVGKKYVGEQFSKRDSDFLSTIAPLAANAVSNARLYEMAILDGLTRVYIGRYFQQRCKEEIRRARRYKKILSLVIWDIDHFKDVNDTYGHLVGDTVLREVAALFRHSYRQGVDLIARYGGEEFVMLLPDTPVNGAYIMAERVRKTVSKHPFANGKVKMTISGGIASFPEDGDNYTALIEQADLQLYKAKRAGRNRIFWKKTDEGHE